MCQEETSQVRNPTEMSIERPYAYVRDGCNIPVLAEKELSQRIKQSLRPYQILRLETLSE